MFLENCINQTFLHKKLKINTIQERKFQVQVKFKSLNMFKKDFFSERQILPVNKKAE